MKLSTIFLAALSACGVTAHRRGCGTRLPGRNMPLKPGIQNGTFDQLIDHKNPHLGTFKQRYWYDTDYWAGPGSPVVLFSPGEEDGSLYRGYCTNLTISGQLAQRVGGATIVLEHRYWGTSAPFEELTTANLKYHTLENAIADLTHFAETVKLPFARGHQSNAKHVPWVMVGGSYPGALTAFVESTSPGTFWASLASSAPVQSIGDFWQYYSPIEAGMPKNCSADVEKVITHIDQVVQKGNTKDIQALKEKFGLGNVKHVDDFLSALQNGPWLWQSGVFYAPFAFDTFCDYVENAYNSSSPAPGPEGVGLTKAIEGYAKWMREVEIPGSCEAYGYSTFQGVNNTGCYDSYDPNNPIYKDIGLDNKVNRSWMWMLCNEPFQWWQTASPKGVPSIVSRSITPEYFSRTCALYFPKGPNGETFGLAKGRTSEQVNKYTGGWNMDQRNLKRIVFTNGQFDPWRSGSMNSEYRPQGQLQSSANVMVNLIPDGDHCSDFIYANGVANAGVKAVQTAEIEQIAEWIKEWPRHY